MVEINLLIKQQIHWNEILVKKIIKEWSTWTMNIASKVLKNEGREKKNIKLICSNHDYCKVWNIRILLL